MKSTIFFGTETTNDIVPINHNGKISFIIPKFKLQYYHNAVTNIIPSLEQDKNDLIAWKNERRVLFNEAINDYFKLKKAFVITLGFAIGGCMFSFAILTSVIIWAVLEFR